MFTITGTVVLLQLQLTIPPGVTPTVDGVNGRHEWLIANSVEAPGVRVHTRRDGPSTYFLIEGAAPGLAHVCIARGDTVHILHASASPGRATYRREGERYQRTTGFAFQLRDGTPGRDTARARFLRDSHWAASTIGEGPGAREFVVKEAVLRAGDRLSVAWFSPLAGVGVWPPDVADGCAATELIMGDAGATQRFDPARWAAVRFDAAPGEYTRSGIRRAARVAGRR